MFFSIYTLVIYTVTFFPCTVEDLNLIMTKLRQTYIVGSLWYKFCGLLGMDRHELVYSERIHRGNMQNMLYSLLIEWIRGSGFRKPTWKNLIEALERIGEHNAAYEISAYVNENKQ